jgi:peptidylprolyl isomerase
MRMTTRKIFLTICLGTLFGSWGMLEGIAAENEARKLPDGLYAEMETSKGTIVLQLEFEKAPLTVANFVGLAEGTKNYSKTPGEPPKPQGKPFYDGLTFHRVIPNFMIQGGDPNGNGTGGPGYKFRNEVSASLKHDRAGILSMANAGPDTNGSQFFITHKDTPWLDGGYNVFGHVVEGQDVVNKVVIGDKIKSVKILRIGEKAKAFKGDEADFQKFSKS